MEGIELAPGGSARRPASSAFVDPLSSEERKKATEGRRRLDAMLRIGDPELAGADKVIAMLGSELKKMPDDIAARTAHAVAARMARDGKWAEAREVFGLLASQLPRATRWRSKATAGCSRYHASSEARRRTEIQQKSLHRRPSRSSRPTPGRSSPAERHQGSVNAGAPAVQGGRLPVRYCPTQFMRWHQACLDLEPKLAAFGPIHSRDPAPGWLPRCPPAGRPPQRRDHVRPRLLQKLARRRDPSPGLRCVARLPRCGTVDDRPQPGSSPAEAVGYLQTHRDTPTPRRQA